MEKSQSKNIQDTKNVWTWHWLAIIVGLVLLAFGVFAMANPEATFSTISIVLGIAIVVRAVMVIVSGFRHQGADEQARANTSFVLGGFLAIVGVVFLFRPEFSNEILIYIAAVIFLLDALSNVFLLPRLWRHNGSMLVLAALSNIVTLVAAVMLLVQPALSWFTVPLGVGIALFSSGITYIIFGIASQGWAGRRRPVREITD